MDIRKVQFFAIVITALALIPSGAHLAVLPNKIGLPQAEYFTVQDIYRGWALFGLLWPIAFAANAVFAFLVRSQKRPFRLALLSALCFALMLAIFFVWTFPANQSTQNWTIAPENWESLRTDWEYSHAANAVLAFLAVCLTTLSALSSRRADLGLR